MLLIMTSIVLLIINLSYKYSVLPERCELADPGECYADAEWR